MKCNALFHIKKINKIMRFGILMIMMIGIANNTINAEENQVIKVGYPIVSGFTDIEEGNYTGYAYEYLTEIAKYTGWEYEFIEMDLNEVLDQLKDGAIDLAAGMLKNDKTQELYDFPELNAGYTYGTLSVLSSNESISSSNYETLNGIKVGYYETSQVKLSQFTEFCETNGIEGIELISYPYEGEETLIQALEAKEVDAIIRGDLLVGEEEKVVAKFGATPYYFATTKGKTDILVTLNQALSKIKENDVTFGDRLYNKYFSSISDDSIHLTQEEQDYINQMIPLKVAYVDNFPPMQDYNEKTMKAEGIYIDLMNHIAQKSGLQFEWVRANSLDETYQMIQNKEVDLLITPDNYTVAAKYDFYLTQDYLEVDIVKVYNVNIKNTEGRHRVAIPSGYSVIEFGDEYEIQYYETIEECLEAVKDGKADFTYGNSHTLSRYLASGYYPNLALLLLDEEVVNVSIGVARPTNLTLLSILNKSIASLSDSEIQDSIFINTVDIKSHVTLEQFFYDNLVFCLAVIFVFILLIWIILRMKLQNLQKAKAKLIQKVQMDGLTSIYNRETGVNLVTEYFERKELSLYSAFLIIDIDYFKQVNDYLGHQCGDEVLIEFSQLLKEFFSYHDIVFRLGGDEFVVLMTDLHLIDLQVVEEKLQELCQLMNKEIRKGANRQKISLSIGAVLTNQKYDFNDLYREADQVLYEVKRQGRNGFKIKNLF